VTNKEISEPTYLEVSDITLKFKHQKATRDRWNNDGGFTESGSSLMKEDTLFN
jgi:hypothetical protein